jgi:hypothetical protein
MMRYGGDIFSPNPRGRYDEYSSKVFSVKKLRYIDQERSRQTTEGDAC